MGKSRPAPARPRLARPPRNRPGLPAARIAVPAGTQGPAGRRALKRL